LNLLVGATGFVGGHLVEYLFQQGEISKGIFRKGSHLKIMDTNGVQGMEADLLDHHSLHEALEGVDVVYNLASPMPGSDSDFLKVNTEGVLNLLEVCKESKVKKLVHLSTIEVSGFKNGLVALSSPVAPSNDYQKSKAESERLLLEFAKRNAEPKITIIRAARAVGSRDETLATPLLRMAEAGEIVIASGPLMSFVHPRDISKAMYNASSAQSATGSLYLVKSFDSTSVDLGNGILSALGSKAKLKKSGFLSSSALPAYTQEQLKAGLRIEDQANWGEIGFVPEFTLSGTCEEIVKWYRKEPWVTEEA
jgi:nucleoside-diphosphate-sugar epimerase